MKTNNSGRSTAPALKMSRPGRPEAESTDRDDGQLMPTPPRRDRLSRVTARPRSRGEDSAGRTKGESDTAGRAIRRARAREGTAPTSPRAVSAPQPFESMFSAGRPQVISRGFDPVFLLVDHGLMERLHATARERGIESDYLLRQILREHIDEY